MTVSTLPLAVLSHRTRAFELLSASLLVVSTTRVLPFGLKPYSLASGNLRSAPVCRFSNNRSVPSSTPSASMAAPARSCRLRDLPTLCFHLGDLFFQTICHPDQAVGPRHQQF